MWKKLMNKLGYAPKEEVEQLEMVIKSCVLHPSRQVRRKYSEKFRQMQKAK